MKRIPGVLAAILVCAFGTHVTRATDLEELATRTRNWEQEAFKCRAEAGGGTPSKWAPFLSKCNKDDQLCGERQGVPDTCDDADSLLFGGLLCLAGDSDGCDLVRRSQDDKGRWWRSPRQKELKPADPPNFPPSINAALMREYFAKQAEGDKVEIDDGSTSMSSDNANGVFAYLLSVDKEEARPAFDAWVKWIDMNSRCTTACGLGDGRGIPRFCESDRCHFMLADCSKFLVTGEYLNVDVPFCHLPFWQVFPHQQLSAEINKLKKQKDELLARADPLLVPAQRMELRKQVDRTFKALADSALNSAKQVERLQSKVERPLRSALGVQNELLAINATVNRKFHARHNVVVSTLLLEKLALSDKRLHDNAVSLAAENPRNAFFEYAAHRVRPNGLLIKIILEECPDVSLKPHPQTEWKWEREPSQIAYLVNRSMYWECVFASRLLVNNPVPENYNSTSTLEDLAHYAMLSQEMTRRLTAFVDAINEMMPHRDQPFIRAKEIEKEIRKEAEQELREHIKSQVATVKKIADSGEVRKVRKAVDKIRPRKRFWRL